MILTEKDVTSTISFEISKNMSAFESLYHNWKNGRYVLDFDVNLPTFGHNLQRPLVWNFFQKEQFIFSIMKGSPIPKICLIKHTLENEKSSIYQVIDGKQRLNAFLEYCDGGFPVNFRGNKFYINDLELNFKDRLLRTNFIADIAYSYFDDPISDYEKISWFRTINFAGTPQDLDHQLFLSCSQIISKL